MPRKINYDKLRVKNIMSLTQLKTILGTSTANVHIRHKHKLTTYFPFPSDHQIPMGKGNEYIVCDQKLYDLLQTLELGGKHAGTGYSPLKRAQQDFQFILDKQLQDDTENG